ncbi:MAG: hypothetical protein QOH48_2487 [Actinomycetota bacterium]|nr:hypothetical protein [Actinomycetota bacterium]
MAPREDQPSGWRAEAETASASGGHLLPEAPLYDQRRSTPAPVPPPRLTEPRRTHSQRRPVRVRRRIAGRRVQRTIRHVDVWSVFKLSIFYYACFTVLWLLFVGILYWLLSNAGLFSAIQKFGRAMVLWNHLNISLIYIEKWALLLAITFLVLGSLINAFIAFLYNFAADTVGGIELTFVEKDVEQTESNRTYS